METMAEQVVDLANKYFDDFTITHGQVRARTCPFCHGGSHNDEKTFFVGLNNGAWYCHRGNHETESGYPNKGSFDDLCNYFGEKPVGKIINFPGSKKKAYDLPEPEMLQPLTDEIVEYFKSRGISKLTLEANDVCSDNDGNIVFPFYRDKVLVYVKMRRPVKYAKEDKAPKEWCLPNTEAIPFGMDNVSFNKPLYITEGIIDSLSLYEAGISNVISVPSGCNNLDFVTTCWDWLEKFDQFVIFGDNDKPGIEMINTLTSRLGEDRCMLLPEYPQLVYNGKDYGRLCKDANEILCCYGPDALRQLAEEAEPAPIKGVIQLADITYVDPMTIPRIMTRIPELDKILGGLVEGGLTVLSGERGSGKSTLASTISLGALEDGEKVCVYSGELNKNNFLNWIILPATERKYVTVKQDTRSGRMFTSVPYEIQRRIKDWTRDRFWLLDNGDIDPENEAQDIINKFTMVARKWGASLYLVDNMMSATSTEEEELRAQTKFSNALKKFAVKFRAHVVLISHPRKRNKANQEFTNDDVAGSANITNVADSVINIADTNISVTKNREFGDTGKIYCSYDPANRRIFQTNIGEKTVYSWDHSNLNVQLNEVENYPEFKIQVGSDEYSDPF